MIRAIGIGAALCALALTGCITPEQLAARDDGTCQSYGAVPGTPSYSDCRIRLAQGRQQAALAYMAQMNAYNQRQQEINAETLRDSQAALRANTPPAPTTTTCTRTSNTTVSCNSF